MQHDQTYERERKNLTEEEEEGEISENETEEEAVNEVNEGNKEDFSVADDSSNE